MIVIVSGRIMCMVVRDIFQNIPEERIIARAIFEDRCKPPEY